MDPTLLGKLESPTFSACLNVASGYNQFLRALASHESVRSLLEQIESRSDSWDLLLRINALVEQKSDPAYENPQDTALAAYLWILNKTDPSVACMAAELVRNCENCWWAQKFAEKLLEERKKWFDTQSSTKVEIEEVTASPESANGGDRLGAYVVRSWGPLASGGQRQSIISPLDLMMPAEWQQLNQGTASRIEESEAMA